jgi:hypothetical protein
MTERLVTEVMNPGLELSLWEVALDILGKAARSQGERGRQALEQALVNKHAWYRAICAGKTLG